MTSHQRLIVLFFMLLIAATRFSAVSKSMWEWDEALFSSGVRDYDVAAHHPHPPGYPLFIGAAKLVRPFVADEFRAVQAVVIASALLLFPAVFFLARSIGFGFGSSLGAGVLCAFIPNVWYYGGTAFTDVPATVLAMFACGLLLRGRESRAAYYLGTALLAISIGFRPQNLLIGLVPGVLATWKQGKRSIVSVLVAALIGIAIVGASYGGAALASSSPRDYFAAVKGQQEYVSKVDSFRNPGREPLLRIAKLFFVIPADARALMIILTSLALLSFLASVVTRYRPVLLTFAIFGPFAIFAWLMLDVAAVSRYSVGYMPMYALLAADVLRGGFVRSKTDGSPVPDMPRIPASAVAQAVGVTLLAGAFIVWTAPALRLVRENDAPNVAAVKWIKANVGDRSTPIYVHAGLRPFTNYYLGENYPLAFFEDPSEVGSVRNARGYAVDVDGGLTRPVVSWRWTRGHLWKVARRRYFDAEVLRVSSNVRFLDGWYLEEGSGSDSWRWMGRSAHLQLPELPSTGQLQMRIGIPLDALPVAPTIEIHANGALIERFVPTEASLLKTVTLASNGAPLDVVITTSGVARNPGDPRDLGLMVSSVAWTPVAVPRSSSGSSGSSGSSEFLGVPRDGHNSPRNASPGTLHQERLTRNSPEGTLFQERLTRNSPEGT